MLQRLVIQAQDQQRDYTLPESPTQEQSWLEIYRTDGVMFSVVLKGTTSYEMRFAVADLKSISFATDRKTLSIDFSTTPTCFKFPKIAPCNKFHEVDAVNIHTLVLYFWAADISVELVRIIYDEFNSRKVTYREILYAYLFAHYFLGEGYEVTKEAPKNSLRGLRLLRVLPRRK